MRPPMLGCIIVVVVVGCGGCWFVGVWVGDMLVVGDEPADAGGIDVDVGVRVVLTWKE